MMGVALIVRPGSAKPEIHEFERAPSTSFRTKVLGGPGALVPHFKTITWNGAVYNCVAYSSSKGPGRNATATMLWKQSLARQDRKIKADDLVGPVLILYGDDEFMKALPVQ